ncbi:MAG TPA: cysteine desulfurase-like protein [Nocardioidaceae bacterium]|nr:cysteine desulfurase-like protein [Nocardioidaceae bacterium]
MEYDVDAVRMQFPALAEGAAHFDGPGGSQVPEPVGRAVADTLTAAVSNRGRRTPAERRADDIVVGARQAMADLLGADPAGVVFGRSMTQLTYDFARMLAKTWQPGDEVVVTRLDHDANIRPWVQAAEAVGARVRWVDFDRDTGALGAEDVAAVLSDRTRLVAVTAASNLLGTMPPIAEIARHAHDVGAAVYVDGVHRTPHAAVDVGVLGADFFACSPYKFLGPHCGVVAGRPDLLEGLQPDKLLPSSSVVPERFELGTLPYELLAGTTAAVDFLAGLAPSGGSRRERLGVALGGLQRHEAALCRQIERRLSDLDGVTLYGHARERTPTVLFSLAGLESTAVSDALAERGVNAPAGSFYAVEASRWIGLGDAGAVRVGVAPYTDAADVERLLAGIDAILDSSATPRGI